VIVVPGEFFDINPGHRRPNRPGRFQHFARFSFGPSIETLDRGIAGLARVLKR
jgi:DNA-binding transcriptional MocR family regulator